MFNNNGSNIKFVAVDFDKTIVDLGVDWKRARQKIAEFCNKPEALDSNNSLFDIMDSSPEISGDIFGIIKEEELSAVQTAKPMPGAKEFLTWLTDKNISFAVVSNNHSGAIAKAFEIFGLPVPRMIIGSDNVKKRKPHTEGLEKALNIAGINTEESIFIGDSDTDVQLGENSNVKTIIVSNDFPFEMIKDSILSA